MKKKLLFIDIAQVSLLVTFILVAALVPTSNYKLAILFTLDAFLLVSFVFSTIFTIKEIKKQIKKDESRETERKINTLSIIFIVSTLLIVITVIVLSILSANGIIFN